MPAADFHHVRHWVFDLDHTLYPPQSQLFGQIEAKMSGFITRELGLPRAQADAVRKDYWHRYGTTLAGLMAEHAIDADAFLHEVHDIDFACLNEDPALADAIAALPGRKIVYTNGSAPYARQVLSYRGLHGVFEAVYGVEHAGYRPKPEAQAFARVFDQAGIDTPVAAMFEDDPRNLRVPHDMGMRTVHVAPTATPEAHIQYHTADLTGFLQMLTEGRMETLPKAD